MGRLAIAREASADLFHTPDGDAFAAVPQPGGHFALWPVCTGICYLQDVGAFTPCCPGLTCYIDPTPAPHKLGFCVTP